MAPAVSMPSPSVASRLRRGLVIPAHPLALTAARKLDERRQRALTRYYVAAGAGGIAVGVHTTQFAIREHGMLGPVLELAAEETRAGEPVVKIAGICGATSQAADEAALARDLGYDAGLLSLAALRDASDEALLAGYWAVCFTDMFQFMFLFPIAVFLAVLSLVAVGGWTSFVTQAPSGFLNPLGGKYGWLFLAAYSVSQAIGYNNFANAQRYFCADTERSAGRIALLCMVLFTIGSFVFYLPPLAARIIMPALGSAPNGLTEPAEAAYMVMGLRLLPRGLVGVLLAAMLASSMASLSATNHLVTGIVAKDLYQGYLRPCAPDRRMLVVSRIASVAVGLTTIAVALLLSRGSKSVFTLLFVFESIFLVPLGLPLLYGLLVPWGPWWSALAAYVVGASTAIGVNLCVNGQDLGHLNETHMIALPAAATTIAFFVPAFAARHARPIADPVNRFFTRLATPVDPAAELGEAPLTGKRQLALVGRVTVGMGLASFALLLVASGTRDRLIVALYALLTTLAGAALTAAGARNGANEPRRREHGANAIESALER
jgi:hypothetical protein